jgi:hypothetical protein|mmetsp:Transcript_1413/g.2565  ORF Transcript_1413/g.2565 Transcript_1413/m.2565 type:complete len:99 (-) Transcript_1413:1634-1930(-)
MPLVIIVAPEALQFCQGLRMGYVWRPDVGVVPIASSTHTEQGGSISDGRQQMTSSDNGQWEPIQPTRVPHQRSMPPSIKPSHERSGAFGLPIAAGEPL